MRNHAARVTDEFSLTYAAHPSLRPSFIFHPLLFLSETNSYHAREYVRQVQKSGVQL